MKMFIVLSVFMSMLNASELAESDFFKGMWIGMPLFMILAILLYWRNREDRQQEEIDNKNQSADQTPR
ncbi:hypothetical protein E0765_07490 [Sulfuricurvum sp. IAE1]|uniref:hypothetical protein n=1 Tax=Sulfuricurvum sp. IAE1 TaxID=2546102 RepID=UPI00104771F5|nr:hypothetical protein [Sulfuricurvum sp. IAE1]TDA63670.1 hypothetical protein E0765_07490 [Sulfuricurvum sp. IAE1]